MIEMVTKGGKKVGEISDSSDGTDTLIINGRKISLDDVYHSEDLANAFNSKVKELNNDVGNDQYSKRFTG